MARQAAIVSYRLGGRDGVSVEAGKWAWALRELGYEVRRVAGEIEDTGAPDDVVVDDLRIDATTAPDPAAVADGLAGAELIVVENLCSLPLNPLAARATASAAAASGARVVFHHHDLPWQRRNLTHQETEFPPRVPDAVHVTINLRSRRELQARGFSAHTIHNYFDLDPAPGDRDATRAAFGFGPDDLVVFQPARAIERKNVPGGVRFATRLTPLIADRTVRYWLSGPAEDGYAPALARVLERATVPVTIGRAPSAADAYAASDVVVFPSTWEGFGNPTIESIAARRPLAAFSYPVLAEIVATGVRFFSVDEPADTARFLAQTDANREQYLDVNLRRARLSYSIDELPGAIEAILQS